MTWMFTAVEKKTQSSGRRRCSRRDPPITTMAIITVAIASSTQPAFVERAMTTARRLATTIVDTRASQRRSCMSRNRSRSRKLGHSQEKIGSIPVHRPIWAMS